MIRRPPRSTLFLHDALPILHRHHEEEHRRENDGDAADPGEHATAEHLLEVERSEERRVGKESRCPRGPRLGKRISESRSVTERRVTRAWRASLRKARETRKT